jgi:hypothetical protein
MTVNLSSFAGVGAQFFDNNGVVLTGGLIYSYAAGTTTPLATYTTSSGSTAHTNPIVLDSAGRLPSGGELWLTFGTLYKFILKTSVGVTIATYDNVGGIGGTQPTIANFTGTGSQTTFALGSTPANENYTNVYVNGVYQQKNTYSISTSNLVFSTAPPYTALIEISFI